MDISLLILGCKNTIFFLISKYPVQYFFIDKKFKVFSLNLKSILNFNFDEIQITTGFFILDASYGCIL